MKTNNVISATNFLESLIIAIVIILVGAVAAAKGQNNLPEIKESSSIESSSIINGLVTPNAADRFFKAGREDFEQEINFLKNSAQYFDGELLQIDPELIEEMKNNSNDLNLNRDWLIESN